MKHNYTPEKIIQFIYGEPEALEKMEIEYALSQNDELNHMFLNLYNSFKCLPKVKFYPSSKTMKNILEYSSRKTSTAC